MKWESTIKSGKYEYRRYSGSLWLKIFYHNMETYEGFYNASEAMQCNSAYKYSILSELNKTLKQKNNKYEFILEYPDRGTMNHWQQTNSPLEETEHGQKVVSGYHKIYIGETKSSWGGLAKSSSLVSSRTLINGTPGDITASDWSYAIGMYNGVTWPNRNLPAGCGPTNIVYLWVKIPEKGATVDMRHIYKKNFFVYIIVWFILY